MKTFTTTNGKAEYIYECMQHNNFKCDLKNIDTIANTTTVIVYTDEAALFADDILANDFED